MKIDQHAQIAAAAINERLGGGIARPIPSARAIVELTADADREPAINAVRAALAPEQLKACPLMIWHGPAEVLIGPHGAISAADLVPGVRSADVRVDPTPGTQGQVVLSWLDGPTREEVANRLAGLPSTGLDIRLLREELDSLLADVIDAAYTARGDMARIAAHPVLDRVAAVRDGRDIYYYLLDLTAALLPIVKRQRAQRYRRIMTDVGDLTDQDAVDAVLDDLDTRMLGGEFFPVRAVNDEATLAALFAVLALTARAVSPTERAHARDDVVLP